MLNMNNKQSKEWGNPIQVYRNEHPGRPSGKLLKMDEARKKALLANRKAFEEKMRRLDEEEEIDDRYRGLIEDVLDREEGKNEKGSKWDSSKRKTPPGERQENRARWDKAVRPVRRKAA
jgi:hypothetical protein